MAEEIRSDGKKTIIKKQDSQQIIEPGNYQAHTENRVTSHSSTGVVESGSSRNVEIKGNSQESYAGRGVTAQYSFKVVGSPQMFSGQAQRAADKSLAKLASLLLQTGDDRFTKPSSFKDVLPDVTKMVSKMSSSFTSSLSPSPPQISRIQDIGKLTAYMGAYLSTVSAEQAAYQSAMAAKVELERQIEQKKQALRQLKKSFDQGEISTEMIANFGADDTKQGEPNISRATILKNVDLQNTIGLENGIN